jgi:creatinine amidohydrolase
VRNKRKYWKNGVWGNPGKASADKGGRLNDLVVAKIVELVKTIENFQE